MDAFETKLARLSNRVDKPDLRITRLVISTVKIHDLASYFFSKPKMNLALRYFGLKLADITTIDIHAIPDYVSISLDSLIWFFDALYSVNMNLFKEILEYALNDIVRAQKVVPNDFDLFLRELHTLGYTYDAKKGQIQPLIGHEEEEIKTVTELDSMLGKLNSKYVSMRLGAWDALLSRNPDNYRQSISSIRELLRQVLDQLGSGETRKDKVRSILASSTETELVDSLAEVIDKLYAFQSAKEHTETEFESTLFAIREAEHVLYFILKRAKVS
jgi:hypothetical protein